MGDASSGRWSIARLTREDDLTSIRSVRDLSADEFDRLRSSSVTLQQAGASDVFEILTRNMEALDGLQMTLGRRSRRSSGDDSLRLPPGYFGKRLLSALSNYLSAGRMYTDSMCDVLSASHGKGSDEFLGFKADLAAAFDESAGYRFTYHLRNALQHIGTLPLSITHTTADALDDKVQIVTSRDSLLEKYKWQKQVRDDLRSGPEVVQLLPLLRDGYAAYVEIERSRVRRLLESAKADLVQIEEALSGLWIDGSALVLLELAEGSQPPETPLTFSQVPLPSSVYTEALHRAHQSGDYIGFLPSGYARQAAEEPTPVPLGMRLGPALDVLDAFYAGGPHGANGAINRVIQAGPAASAATIAGFMNLSAINLSQLEMALGVGVDVQLADWREDES